ncbi:hypothetical protein THZG08_450044 [Vibrio owensii]|nr:hypothetical protein THZG08_450044 [Vibrio owensii]CAH1580132.1 hypothetical protein THOA03_450044 [Vibrio owensii]
MAMEHLLSQQKSEDWVQLTVFQVAKLSWYSNHGTQCRQYEMMR